MVYEYTNTTTQVLSPDGDHEFFEILAGVLPGDTLAPYLFIIALDYTMRQAVRDETTKTYINGVAKAMIHLVIC